jgi:hypothetical protein
MIRKLEMNFSRHCKLMVQNHLPHEWDDFGQNFLNEVIFAVSLEITLRKLTTSLLSGAFLFPFFSSSFFYRRSSSVGYRLFLLGQVPPSSASLDPLEACCFSALFCGSLYLLLERHGLSVSMAFDFVISRQDLPGNNTK